MAIFDISIFFIVFRETLECTVIMSLLFGIIDRIIPPESEDIPSLNQEITAPSPPTSISSQDNHYRRIIRRLRRFQQRENTSSQELRGQLKRIVVYGTIAGIFISILLGILFVCVLYIVIKGSQNGTGGLLWEAFFSLLTTVLITLIAWYMVRVTFWKEKLEKQIKKATLAYLERYIGGNKWFLFFLPLTIVMREALESFIFISGSLNQTYISFLISIGSGVVVGCLGGYLIFKFSNLISVRAFSTVCTILFFFVAAGLFGTAISSFESATNSENSDRIYLWNLNCCDPETDQGWEALSGTFGWTNKASLGQVIGYIVYWIVALLRTYFILRKSKVTDVNEANNNVA
ncbi:iron permease FTR1/Fip1/EfeU [Gigaspora rosea]|uniref:Iron permease FTR1/Fip1/EfeU n=1 Tax=Gigaspora rosea TaxID=44941 RepID=A0A397VD87_9GLOM|nr:iron permease FTR1/Fip1/EfeU [Gigaspora rosea]